MVVNIACDDLISLASSASVNADGLGPSSSSASGFGCKSSSNYKHGGFGGAHGGVGGSIHGYSCPSSAKTHGDPRQPVSPGGASTRYYGGIVSRRRGTLLPPPCQHRQQPCVCVTAMSGFRYSRRYPARAIPTTHQLVGLEVVFGRTNEFSVGKAEISASGGNGGSLFEAATHQIRWSRRWRRWWTYLD